MIDAHPALVAVSPQAPIADWFFDDFHHHGAFFLPHCFNFMASFGKVREGRYKTWPDRFDHRTPDGYAFFLALGSLRNANDRYLKGKNPMWNEIVEHPNYDAFWQRRNLLPHLKNVAPAVMVVGGLFDAEDLYGPLQIYRSIEANNASASNMLVMGPWQHGGWARTTGQRLGNVDFGAETSAFYQEEIEAPFFIHHLEEGPAPDLPEAYVFETGLNRWRRFEQWPPQTQARTLYPHDDGTLTEAKPSNGASTWVSDPAAPVPFSETIATGMDKHYMTADQRFAARRPDVMVYETEPLAEPLTLAGPIVATLFVSTTQRDADFVVKVIDVFPGDATMPDERGKDADFGDYQMMVRSEVIRARFRDSYSDPKPMKPGAVTKIELPLQDVLHTFDKGHRVMVQVQSTWFPLVDRNPQKWVANIFEARDTDFVRARHTLHHSRAYPTHLEVGVLPR